MLFQICRLDTLHSLFYSDKTKPAGSFYSNDYISVFGFGGAGLRSVHINHTHPELMTSHCHSYFPNRPACHTADGPTAVHLADNMLLFSSQPRFPNSLR